MQLGQEFQRSKMVATGEDGNYTEADVKRAMNSYNALMLLIRWIGIK